MSTSTVAFDTHKFVKHLVEHGFSNEQAEVLAEEQAAIASVARDQLVTKADLKAEIAGLENRLTWQMIIIGGVYSGIVVGLMFRLFLPR